MEEHNRDQEWYVLEGMKATTAATPTQDPAVSQVEDDGEWYSLDKTDGNQRAGNIRHSVHSFSHVNSISSTHEGINDFQASQSEYDTLSVNTNSLFEFTDENHMVSPSNTRLILQESVDGEISDSRNSSGSARNERLGDISDKHNFTDNDNDSGNNTSLLLQKAEIQASGISASINSTTNPEDPTEPTTQLEDHHWMSLTSSNMQDVNRPEPLGRTTDQTVKSKGLRSTNLNTTVGKNNFDKNSTGERSPRNNQVIDTVSVTSGQGDTQHSNVHLNSSADMPGQIESDIPDLSYTQSCTSMDGQFVNKRVGPAQDSRLQHATDNYLSSTLTSNTSGDQQGSHFSSSKVSNETPITKLLGPAYKQTEKFLKDLKKMKLSYKDSPLSHDGNTSDNSTTLTDRETSKDECCQAGQSKLEFSRIPLEEDNESNDSQNELVEQDIASASLIDFEINGNYQIEKARKDARIVRQQPNDCHHSNSDDQRESEGELFLTELSNSSVHKMPISTSSLRGSSSSKSHPSSYATHSSLEPIKEVLSPDRKNTVGGEYRITTSSPPPPPPLNRSPIKQKQHQLAGNEASFAENSFQTGTISSTSTPQIDHVIHHTSDDKKMSTRGIYDIRDSTSPGSSNRKRLIAGKPPKESRSGRHDPFKIYVSDDSKMATSMESTAIQEPRHNDDIHPDESRTSSMNVPKSIDLHHSLIDDVAKQLQGIEHHKSSAMKKFPAVANAEDKALYKNNNTSPRKQQHSTKPTGVQVPSLNTLLNFSLDKTSPSYRDTTGSFLSSDDSTLRSTTDGQITTSTTSTEEMDSSLPSGDTTTMTPPYKHILKSKSKKPSHFKPNISSESNDFVGRYTLMETSSMPPQDTSNHGRSHRKSQDNTSKEQPLIKHRQQNQRREQQQQLQQHHYPQQQERQRHQQQQQQQQQLLEEQHQEVRDHYSKQQEGQRHQQRQQKHHPQQQRQQQYQHGQQHQEVRQDDYLQQQERQRHQQQQSDNRTSPISSTTKVKRSDRVERGDSTYRTSSLNELWNTFERTYKDSGKRQKSPLIKKLEMVSSLLHDSKSRSPRLHDASPSSPEGNSSTSVISYCESHSSLIRQRMIDQPLIQEHSFNEFGVHSNGNALNKVNSHLQHHLSKVNSNHNQPSGKEIFPSTQYLSKQNSHSSQHVVEEISRSSKQHPAAKESSRSNLHKDVSRSTQHLGRGSSYSNQHLKKSNSQLYQHLSKESFQSAQNLYKVNSDFKQDPILEDTPSYEYVTGENCYINSSHGSLNAYSNHHIDENKEKASRVSSSEHLSRVISYSSHHPLHALISKGTSRDTENEPVVNTNNNNNNNGGNLNLNGNLVNNICPLCQRREVATNYPTPSMSEVDEPLTLQTWTQTSPYIIDTDLIPKSREFDADTDDRESKNRLVRKGTYTVLIPAKSYSQEKNESKTRKKDIPYTAWFHSIRSDVSDVIPLSHVPSLNSLYTSNQAKRAEQVQRESSVVFNNLPNSLQDAFLQHKKRFIERSKQRLQEVKDARLLAKHGDKLKSYVTKKPIEQVKHNTWFVNTGNDNKKITKKKNKRESPREIFKERFSSEDSPRFTQRLEEQRMENLKRNRLKMKQYDLKNREQFLKRRSKGVRAHRPKCVVVRH